MSKMIIDVREPEEFEMGHVEGAINIPISQIETAAVALKNIPKDTELIVYCRTGNRSATSKDLLHDLGYLNVTNGINQHHVEANYL